MKVVTSESAKEGTLNLGFGPRKSLRETPISIGVRVRTQARGVGRGREKKEGRRGGVHGVEIMYKLEVHRYQCPNAKRGNRATDVRNAAAAAVAVEGDPPPTHSHPHEYTPAEEAPNPHSHQTPCLHNPSSP